MSGDALAGAVVVTPVYGIPEVQPGDDLAELIATHAPHLADGDIVVVSSKIVSKSEGRVVEGTDRAAAVRSETVRVVAERGTTQIVQTRHGFVMAAGGVDASNVAPGRLLLLPIDSDHSAREIRRGLTERLGVHVGVIVTDTFGRPWRLGQTDLAIGAAGVRVLEEHRGRTDAHGNELVVTAPAHADEVAGAAELVKGKVAQVPVAVVRGLRTLVTAEDGPGVRALVRSAEDDMFRLGAREARREALRLSRDARELADAPTDVDLVRRALDSVPDRAGSRWGLVEVEEAQLRKPILDAVGLPSSVPYVAVAYLGAGAFAEQAAALLELGGARDRLVLSCAVEGLASRWLPASRVDVTAVGSAVPEDAEVVGLLAIGASAS
ncbi:coenzyme F420-0:L-glutamate ligase [Actinopolymorpha pittospori]|uniref:Coenzyme F420-0:L-glutamate ligase/coenzyme F420-1:gamma-L-glutamate ligase n=1 Tax=Actinopolymorpha pittospori TaxID=648752 RepID=A0A927MX12_9ACTN|nr:coenzyme F420-0:L-glutamate ligase/coenzyme F420-1:gamma-L-glutamate ligase [Actinopolymorpha pittospori]